VIAAQPLGVGIIGRYGRSWKKVNNEAYTPSPGLCASVHVPADASTSVRAT
jgi:hypothetical protein